MDSAGGLSMVRLRCSRDYFFSTQASAPSIYGIEKPNRLCKDIGGFQTGFSRKFVNFGETWGLSQMALFAEPGKLT